MGMFGEGATHRERLTILGDPVGSDNAFPLMRAPRNLTVLSAHVVSENAQNAGTAVTLALQNWGTAGTAVKSDGTVVPALGGTASGSRLSARTPVAGTVSAAAAYVAEGEWLYVFYTEEGTGWISGDVFTYEIEYTYGVSG